MKRLLALFLIFSALLSITACSGNPAGKEPTNPPTTEPPTTESPTTEPPADPEGCLAFTVYETYCVVSGIGNYTGSDVVIPSTYNGLPVTGIAERAFNRCSALTTITIPDSVTCIGNSAFSNCTSLKSITIPDGITTIGSMLFSRCTALANITIPSSITKIDATAFVACSSLSTIAYTGTTKQWNNIAIDRDWFGIPATEVTCTDGIAHLYQDPSEYFVYNNCENYYMIYGRTDVTMTDIEIPRWYKYLPVTTIGPEAFAYCTSLRSIIIPDSVTTIGEKAFYECTNLTEISIPSTVTVIDWMTFFNCTKLNSITLPNGVTTIDEFAFLNCTGLSSITLPESLTLIDAYAFENCTILKSISYSGTVDQWQDIAKTPSWNANIPATEVVCSNGTVAIS